MRRTPASLFFVVTLCLSTAAFAGPKKAKATLSGLEEVPPVSTTGEGSFVATIAHDEMSFEYELEYTGLVGSVTQAHIHFGQPAVNGGIMVFLCSNLPMPPAGTPACPASPDAVVSGVLTPASVIGPNGQGIAPGDFAEVIAAIRSGTSYANVHSTTYPGGEIRGQLK